MTREIRLVVVVNFDRYHPLNKTVSAEVRAGGPLKWVRWNCDSHRDPVLLDLPREERWLWPVLVGLAGTKRREADGSRVIVMTSAQLAREADMTEAQVEHALAHLARHDQVIVERGGRAGGGRVARTTRGVATDLTRQTNNTNQRGVQGGDDRRPVSLYGGPLAS